MSVLTHDLPLLIEEVVVRSVQRLSPSFVRVELGADALAEFGVDGPLLDQRIKLVFPAASGRLPRIAPSSPTWYADWLELPEDERGHMRTYSVRAVRGAGADTRIVVDIVLHPDGECGPGGSWAEGAAVGDRVIMTAPRRGHHYGGIEFAPPTDARLLLVGDETAVPAICRILGDLPDDAAGAAYVEVPQTLDIQDVCRPAGVDITWLVRDRAGHGERLHAAVLEHLGERTGVPLEVAEVDPDLWETPTWSSSGEPLERGPLPPESSGDSGGSHDDLYAWIAGESGVVTALRRHLVRELGIDRRQVCFMGYWRRGVAMRS